MTGKLPFKIALAITAFAIFLILTLTAQNQKILAEIAMKNYLKLLYKRLLEQEKQKRIKQYGYCYYMEEVHDNNQDEVETLIESINEKLISNYKFTNTKMVTDLLRQLHSFL